MPDDPAEIPADLIETDTGRVILSKQLEVETQADDRDNRAQKTVDAIKDDLRAKAIALRKELEEKRQREKKREARIKELRPALDAKVAALKAEAEKVRKAKNAARKKATR